MKNEGEKRNKTEEITSKMAHLKSAFLICFLIIIRRGGGEGKERLTAFQLNKD